MDVLVRLRAVLGVSFAVRAAFGAVVVLLAGHVEVTASLYGLLIALIPLMELIAVPFIGLYSDRFGHHRILLFGGIIAVAAMVLRAIDVSGPTLIVSNLLHGVAAAATLVPALALVSEMAPPAHRGRAMGAFDFISVFGAFIGYIAGFLIAGLPSTVSFLILAGILIAGFTWLHFDMEPLEDHPENVHFRHVVATARQPEVALIVAPWLLVFMFIGGLVSFFPSGALNVFGWGILPTVLGVALFGGVVGGSQIAYGHLSDRIGRGPLLLLGAGGFAVLMVAVAMLILISDGNAHFFLVLFRRSLLLLIPAGLATLAFGPASLAALADAAEHGPTGVTMSLYSMVLAAGYVLGPLLFGLALDPHLGGPLGLAGYHVTMGIGLVALVIARQVWQKGGWSAVPWLPRRPPELP